MNKTAIILGASGLTGSLLLQKLLKDERYGTILLFSRKEAGISHPKVKEIVIDLFRLEDASDQFKADEVFCCIGTTKKKTPDQDEYRKIDFGIPVTAAQLCVKNDINAFLVISSMGASPKSSIFYSRTKGEMEEAVLAMGIPNTYILRPSLITGNRQEKRGGEKLGAALFKVFNLLLIGGLKKYRSIKATQIADAMIRLANEKPEEQIILSNWISELGGRKTVMKESSQMQAAELMKKKTVN